MRTVKTGIVFRWLGLSNGGRVTDNDLTNVSSLLTQAVAAITAFQDNITKIYSIHGGLPVGPIQSKPQSCFLFLLRRVYMSQKSEGP